MPPPPHPPIILAHKSYQIDVVSEGLRQMREHCPMSTATTHTGSSCACSGGQSRFGLVLVTAIGQSKAGQLLRTIHNTVSCCRHCDGEVVIHVLSTNGHLIITLLLSMSKIQAFLRAFYTQRYIAER